MQACAKAKVEPLIAMTFGNRHYDSPKGPTTPAGYAGYAKYGRAILDKYAKQVKWLEIWNEYNGTWCPDEAKQDRPKYYTEMLKAAYTEIKAARPDVQVLGGAAVLIPLPYFEGIFKRGGLAYMDGVVIHPYRSRPEGVDREVQELKALIRKYNDGKDKPIWVTETGRHTKDEYDWEAGRKMFEKGRAEGARYLARQYTLLLKEEVAKIYWYLACDHASFVSMGLLRHHQKEESGMGEYAVAPSYVAYANLIHHLDSAKFVAREAERPYTRAHVYHFQTPRGPVRVVWATQPASIRLKTRRPVTIADLMGRESIVEPVDGQIIVPLSEDAQYITGAIDEVTEIDTGVRVLASSLDDYAKTQGENNWSYGYFVGDDYSAFKPLQQVETMWGYNWGGVSKYLSIGPNNAHPDQPGGKDLLPARRWTSPVAGRVTLKATFSNAGKGDGVIAGIIVDGKELLAQPVGGQSRPTVELETPLDLRAGSTVDIVIKPGKTTAYDSTTYEVMVVQAP